MSIGTSRRCAGIALILLLVYPSRSLSLATEKLSPAGQGKPDDPDHLVENLLIAGPNNFNPALHINPSPPPPQLPISPKSPPQPESPNDPESVNSPQSGFRLEGLESRFKFDRDNFGQQNQFLQEALTGHLGNGDRLRFTTGFNSFAQEEQALLINVPFYGGWERQWGQTKLSVNGGVDWFDRLAPQPYGNAKVEYPVFVKVGENNELRSLLVISGEMTYSAYKFNAKTLDNGIETWQFRPSIYWQINPQNSLFSTFEFGNFSDGNQELQSFSRFEHRFGQYQFGEFSLAANLFTWAFRQDLDEANGYFSPPDFLVYNLEASWRKQIFEPLTCRLFAAYGQQRLEEVWDNAFRYGSDCTIELSDHLALDLGYNFSNVLNKSSGDSSYNNHAVTTQVHFKF
jgi:hypothetical protein